MGNENNSRTLNGPEKNKEKEATPLPDALNLKKYNKIGVIGRGGFGRVHVR